MDMGNGHQTTDDRLRDEDLLGYALRALDPEAERELDIYLAGSPEARRRLELFRQALEPLAADRQEEAPPPGLAVRTLARVAEYCCRELPKAPAVSAAPAAPSGRRWWRRADVLV